MEVEEHTIAIPILEYSKMVEYKGRYEELKEHINEINIVEFNNLKEQNLCFMRTIKNQENIIKKYIENFNIIQNYIRCNIRVIDDKINIEDIKKLEIFINEVLENEESRCL